MIDRAVWRLSEARTSGEILEARQIAQAALHYAKVTKAANETHADCLRIIVRAEMRMADAVDEGQAAGDIRTKAHNQHVRASDKLASLGEIGVPRQRLAEWRVLRDAGIEAVYAAIYAQVAEGRRRQNPAFRRRSLGTRAMMSGTRRRNGSRERVK